jgi:hypothetical protein
VAATTAHRSDVLGNGERSWAVDSERELSAPRVPRPPHARVVREVQQLEVVEEMRRLGQHEARASTGVDADDVAHHIGPRAPYPWKRTTVSGSASPGDAVSASTTCARSGPKTPELRVLLVASSSRDGGSP